jgi:hypothetical protein
VRAEFERRFTSEVMARRYTSIYRQLLAARAERSARLEEDLRDHRNGHRRPLHVA